VANKKTKKAAPAKKQDDSNVVRIKATSSPATKKIEEKAVVETTTVKAKTEKAIKAPKVKKPRATGEKNGLLKVLGAIGGYFKGAWVELRLVRWPNRRATWSLTGAVLLYSAFFVVLVLLLDAGFKYLFELILGK
jgi:preprotein translocase SecE subunit